MKLHQKLSSKILEPLFWKLKKLPVIERYKQFSALQWDSFEKYEKRQNHKLHEILSYAIKEIPFYKNALQTDLGDIESLTAINLLSKFPILTKNNLKFDTNNLYKEIGRNTFKNSTGGSTGRPVTIYQDSVYQTNSLAATLLMYEWAGRPLCGKLIKLWGAERDLVKGGYGLKQKINDFIGNRVTLNSFRMTAEHMQEYIKTINKCKPVCLEAYVDALYDLSEYIEKNKIEVESPGCIVSSAGVLYPHMREKIENIFRCRVYDRYGSRDAGNMAAECDRHNGLHIFGENSYLEVVDGEGNEVGVGQEGRILLTNLDNYTMPLIRYEIGDRAIKGEPCDCGRPYPMLKSIIGREGSSFKTEGGGVVSPVFFIHMIGVMCNDGAVDKFQVIQEKMNEVTVKIKPYEKLDVDSWSQSSKIITLIKKAMGKNCSVSIVVVKDIELTPTGKHLYTICNI
jgi:phenylacetate-CoA ligase